MLVWVLFPFLARSLVEGFAATVPGLAEVLYSLPSGGTSRDLTRCGMGLAVLRRAQKGEMGCATLKPCNILGFDHSLPRIGGPAPSG